MTVSIAFPCWNRGRELRVTLESIKRQNYPVELVVVEDGDDGLTEALAAEYGAKYFRRERTEAYPIFQNIASLWNLCMKHSTGDILILQTAEVLHESENVIAELVACVESKPKILATPLIKDLAPDGSFAGWYNHPREGSRPGWVSGAGPHAFRKSEMLEIGGYTELMYGYGHEDDLLMFMLRKNGWSIEYVESAVCAHQWHERVKYEPVTGYANRALLHILTMEIEDGTRLPVANRQPLEIDTSTTEQDVTAAVAAALSHRTLQMSMEFKAWATECWLNGNRHPDIIFVYQRNIANEGLGRVSEIGEMITEAAWAVVRAEEARKAAAITPDEKWARRALERAEITHTWAARALSKARKLMEEK
jgi:glycosyltransferase involved in cell wall biosynthesis